MTKRYIRVYLKNLLKDRLSFFINFFGLSLALAAAFMTYVYISYETRYDRHVPPAVYRVSVEKQEQGKVNYRSAKSYSGLVHLFKELPAVQSSARILYEQCLFRLGDKKLADQQVYWADSSFADLFHLNMLKGPRGRLLAGPNEALISRSAAIALFGNGWQSRDDLFSGTLLLNEGLPFKIAGVFEDYPRNSHMTFDYLLSFSTLTKVLGPGLGEVMPPGANFVYTYVRLNSAGSAARTEARLNALFRSRLAENKDVVYRLNLQPVSAIHLDSHLADELTPGASRQLVDLLKLVTGLIVLIALVNYVNLSVSIGMKRVPEIGMRKVLGATKTQLAFQFAVDSLMSFLIVFALSFVLVRVFINLSYDFLQIRIPDAYYYTAELWGAVLLFVALITLLPAVYMGVTLASIGPFSSGVSQVHAFGKIGSFRKSLVVVQFVASTFLVSGTILISRQVDLMQNYHLGYDKQNVVVLKSPRTLIGNPERENLFEVFKSKLRSSTRVVSVASGSVIPGEEFLLRAGNVRRTGAAPLEGQNFSIGFTDGNFFETLHIRLLAGRTFDRQKSSRDAVINRRAMKTLGFLTPQDAIGQEVQVFSDADKRKIVGVIEDYHHLSVHQTPSETIFLHGPDYEFGYYLIRIRGGGLAESLAEIRMAWTALYPDDPFDYFFLDSFFERQYQGELRFKRTFFAFSLLAIVISCLGLFGLSLYSLQLRQREVCIRRIMGASTTENVLLLSKEYLVMILAAVLLSAPLILYFSRSFLGSFPYRVGQAPGYYLLVGVMMLSISFLTILYNVMKVSGRNPAKVLRNP